MFGRFIFCGFILTATIASRDGEFRLSNIRRFGCGAGAGGSSGLFLATQVARSIPNSPPTVNNSRKIMISI